MFVTKFAAIFAAVAADETPVVSAPLTVTADHPYGPHAPHSHSSGCEGTDFDFFVLAVQWPGSWGASPPADGGMTLHGLWPSRTASSSYPCECTQVPFQQSEVPAEASTLWYSNKGDNTAFWTHEWSKHGTCANLGDQQAYMQDALQLRSKYLVAPTLTALNLQQPTDLGKVMQAVDAAYAPGSVALICAGGGHISGAYVCLDAQQNPMRCPETTMSEHDICRGMVTFGAGAQAEIVA